MNYKKQLIALGINEDLLLSLTDAQCQLLHSKLQVNYFLKIKKNWQLMAILGDEEPFKDLDRQDDDEANMAHYAAMSDSIDRLNEVKQKKPELFSQTDSMGNSAAYFAVCSGSLVALQWINENYPELFDSLNAMKEPIAHSATIIGRVDVLQWMKENKPELLDQSNPVKQTLAHWAALLGRVDILQWIKENRPALLDSEADGETIAHYAARSKKADALQWIKANCPHLLTKKNKQNESIATSAAPNPQQFHLALALSGHRQEVNFLNYYNRQFLEGVVPMLLNELNSNYTLTKVVYPQYLNGEERKGLDSLEKLLDENKSIPTALKAASGIFSVSFRSKEGWILPKNVMFEIFKAYIRLVSTRVPESEIQAQFNILWNNSIPARNSAAKWVDRELAGLKKEALLEKAALSELKALILEKDSFTESDLKRWHQTYGKTIKWQISNQTMDFFKPLDTISQALMRRLCKHFGFDEKKVIEVSPADYQEKAEKVMVPMG